MREIVFDTETTGLDFSDDRVIEIGAIEMDNRFVTGRVFHHYINPQGRAIHPDALAVHGIGEDQLKGKPHFGEIVEEFAAFIEGANLVAHNARFDISFINAEFKRLKLAPIGDDRVVDTLQLAKRKHPMGPNSLDALCRRYGIDNSRRTKHGALLDSELLAEVYIELIGGKQTALVLEASSGGRGSEAGDNRQTGGISAVQPRAVPLPSRLDAETLAAHDKLVAGLGEKAIWAKFASAQTAEG
ncbi:DNA polymerase III subunit epsilon [Mesorhizobium sp. RP14(2022)]|uniref:DNA polymerase III subunit epsilon n=1 Tax=Mesorhizobium liriopis TaxID=2953882 RepID=A0ABT1C250_9HYPH|nr:DNA polymerase III subunit epsilon [Mesorhizobium liriopis]MCO6048879.1 DNA polymerase III subunit epsilon [Mesorhizobium liriopis]